MTWTCSWSSCGSGWDQTTARGHDTGQIISTLVAIVSQHIGLGTSGGTKTLAILLGRLSLSDTFKLDLGGLTMTAYT